MKSYPSFSLKETNQIAKTKLLPILSKTTTGSKISPRPKNSSVESVRGFRGDSRLHTTISSSKDPKSSSSEDPGFRSGIPTKNHRPIFGTGARATVVALTGDLGAGKTALTRALLRSMGVKGRVTSPTFTLIRHYRLSKTAPFKDAYHIDCYRLRKPEELLVLGFEETLNNPDNLLLIEWPELMEKYLPKNTVRLSLKHGEKKNERVIEIS